MEYHISSRHKTPIINLNFHKLYAIKEWSLLNNNILRERKIWTIIPREQNGSLTRRQKIIINKLIILPSNLTQKHLMAGLDQPLCDTCVTPEQSIIYLLNITNTKDSEIEFSAFNISVNVPHLFQKLSHYWQSFFIHQNYTILFNLSLFFNLCHLFYIAIIPALI